MDAVRQLEKVGNSLSVAEATIVNERSTWRQMKVTDYIG